MEHPPLPNEDIHLLTGQHLKLVGPVSSGPDQQGFQWRGPGDLSVIATLNEIRPGERFLHLSAAYPDHKPESRVLKAIILAFIPFFPPGSKVVIVPREVVPDSGHPYMCTMIEARWIGEFMEEERPHLH